MERLRFRIVNRRGRTRRQRDRSAVERDRLIVSLARVVVGVPIREVKEIVVVRDANIKVRHGIRLRERGGGRREEQREGADDRRFRRRKKDATEAFDNGGTTGNGEHRRNPFNGRGSATKP